MKNSTRVNLKARVLAMLMLFVMAVTVTAPTIAGGQALLDPVTVTEAAPTPTPGIGNIEIDASGNVTVGATDGKTDFNAILTQYKTLISVFIGFCTLTCAFFLIKAITVFAGSGDNDNKRKQSISSILTTGIGTALLGSVWLWFSFFFHIVP